MTDIILQNDDWTSGDAVMITNMWANCYDLTISNWWLQLTVPPVSTVECTEILKLLCVALLDDLHLSLDWDALGVAITLIHGRKIANGATKCPSMWMENNIHECGHGFTVLAVKLLIWNWCTALVIYLNDKLILIITLNNYGYCSNTQDGVTVHRYSQRPTGSTGDDDDDIFQRQRSTAR